MAVFNLISEMGFAATKIGSYFSDFFWRINTKLGTYVFDSMEHWGVDVPDGVQALMTIFLNRFTVFEFVLGFGLSFFLISHFVKLIREAYLF